MKNIKWINKIKMKNFKRHLHSYGVIARIDNNKVFARLYSMKDDEFIDDVEFDINEFPKEHLRYVQKNTVFYFSVGEIRGKSYSNFRMRRMSNKTV